MFSGLIVARNGLFPAGHFQDTGIFGRKEGDMMLENEVATADL